MADAVAAAVAAVPSVRVDDSTGAGTFLAGRLVRGVRVSGDRIEVHLAVRYPSPVLGAVAAVRQALAPLTDRRLDIAVTDLDPPAPPADADRPGADRLVTS